MKLIIFDLDDTLIDFRSTRQTAYACMNDFLMRQGMDGDAYIRECAQVDRPLFTLFEQGVITRAEYRIRRFSEPFTRLGLAADTELVTHMNKLFMNCVNDSPQLYDDAMRVLQRLRREGMKTAILTNGPSDGQRRKLVATGLGDAVDHVVIGEDIGVSKPSPAAFHSVLERFGLQPADALMVGDSPHLDYDGALNAGLKALLLDREGVYRHARRQCIDTLDRLPQSG